MDYNEYQQRFLKKFKEKNKDMYKVYRRAKQIHTHENPLKCPECGAKTISDWDKGEEYCTSCGLVTKSSIRYVGLHKIHYPYGLLLYNGE